MWMRVAAGATLKHGQRKRVSARYIGTYARTERIIEPDGTAAINANTGDMHATVRVRGTGGLWNSMLGDAITGAVDCLTDNKTANIAIKALCPPDIAPTIKGEQVRCGVISGLGHIFADSTGVQCARRGRRKPPNLRYSTIVLGKPDRATGSGPTMP